MPAEKSLKQVAEQNPSQLGDPVSLKAETSDSEPTENDRPNKHKSLKEVAEEKLETNPSMLGDPISMKAETSSSSPTENDRGAKEADPSKNKNTRSKL